MQPACSVRLMDEHAHNGERFTRLVAVASDRCGADRRSATGLPPHPRSPINACTTLDSHNKEYMLLKLLELLCRTTIICYQCNGWHDYVATSQVQRSHHGHHGDGPSMGSRHTSDVASEVSLLPTRGQVP
jgi:hypothetical protein